MDPAEARTERLLARRPRDADRDGYRRLFLAPEVAALVRPAPLEPFTDATVDAVLAGDRRHWNEHGFGPWALIDASTGAFVGRGGLAWTDRIGERAVELPWAIVPERWHEGLATEAARAAVDAARRLGLPEIVSFTLVENHASRRVMERAGLAYAQPIEHAGLPHVLHRLRL